MVARIDPKRGRHSPAGVLGAALGDWHDRGLVVGCGCDGATVSGVLASIMRRIRVRFAYT
jgi:hypothetical protein